MNKCVICLNETEYFYKTNCRHMICEECVEYMRINMNEMKCPFCNKSIYDFKKKLSEQDKNLGKLIQLIS